MLEKPIAITPGEPAGIGTEITLKAWKDKSCPPFFLIDDAERVATRAKEANLEVPIEIINSPEQTLECFINALPITTQISSSLQAWQARGAKCPGCYRSDRNCRQLC